MNIITVNFKLGEPIPMPGELFNTRNPDAPGGVVTFRAVSILRVHWYGKLRGPKLLRKTEGVSVVMAVDVVETAPQVKEEGKG